MLAKTYFAVCAFGLLTAAAFYLTGNLSPMMQIVFKSLSFSAVCMGLLVGAAVPGNAAFAAETLIIPSAD